MVSLPTSMEPNGMRMKWALGGIEKPAQKIGQNTTSERRDIFETPSDQRIEA